MRSMIVPRKKIGRALNRNETVLDSRDLPREKKSDDTQLELAERLEELLSK